jgi:hypothetical protein
LGERQRKPWRQELFLRAAAKNEPESRLLRVYSLVVVVV